MNVFLNAWNRAIYGLIFADFMCFFAIGLFTDAEVGKYVFKHLGIAYYPEYFTKVG